MVCICSQPNLGHGNLAQCFLVHYCTAPLLALRCSTSPWPWSRPRSDCSVLLPCFLQRWWVALHPFIANFQSGLPGGWSCQACSQQSSAGNTVAAYLSPDFLTSRHSTGTPLSMGKFIPYISLWLPPFYAPLLLYLCVWGGVEWERDPSTGGVGDIGYPGEDLASQKSCISAC